MTFELRDTAVSLLLKRGVKIRDIAELVYFLQENYIPDLTLGICLRSVEKVLAKREVQNAIITGITLDQLAEQNQLDEPLLSIIKQDESLYGVDEVIALAIVNVYGSIGLTNYGYIDKKKPGVLKKLDEQSDGRCHTFLDDIIGAIAAAASSRLAHAQVHQEEDDPY